MHHQDSIGKMLGFLHRSAQKYFNHQLSKYDLGSGAYMFLIYLFHNDGATQNETSSHLDVDKSHATRIFHNLEKLGYVTRKHDIHDKRVYRVYLTKKAISIRTDIKEIMQSWSEIITKDLKENEKDLVKKLLWKMSKNVTDMNDAQNKLCQNS